MTEDKLTYSSVSISILKDMLTDYTEEIITKSVLKEKLTQQRYGTTKHPKFIDSRNEENFPRDTDEDETNNHNKKRHHRHSFGSSSSRSATPQPVNLQKEPDIGRFGFNINGRDVYENAFEQNSKLMGDKASSFASANANDIYFRCSNCQREIAGGRFAAHIDKCLGGRNRRNRDQ